MNFYLAINIFKTQIQRFKKSQNSFTLVELLITIAILAVLSTAVLTILNPQEYLRQSRDSQRLKDLTILSKIISWFETDTGGKGFMGTSSIVYVSIPDTTSTCANLGLPPLPSPWQYRCTTAQNLQKIDGTGWIPIDFNQLSFGRTLSKLPIDPINTTSSGNYYTYVTGGSFKLTSRFESQKQILRYVANDGGPDPSIYELGTDLNLAPFVGGLVGYWSFDEGSGTIAYDRSGYNNNGTLINGPTWQTETNCKVGKCLSFDGVDDVVVASANGVSIGVAPRTIIAWVNPYANTSRWGIIGYGTGDCTGKQFYIGRHSGASFIFWGGCADYYFPSINIPNNSWNFLAITFDGYIIKGFKDGVFVGNTIQNINTPFITKFVIGAESITDALNFRGFLPGLIDEVRVYNRALSDSEIRAIYETTR
ncbi:MAG: LamG-like jellyroll fold domain-containing protein [bacterium]|nr:LamG-like jellyroll fold domain-containing protein [bacterium]